MTDIARSWQTVCMTTLAQTTMTVQPSQGEKLLERLPRDVRESLDNRQISAISSVLDDPAWRKHALDLRFTMPVPGRKLYFTMVGGRELRSPERRVDDREKQSLVTVGNVFFAFGLTTLFALLGILGVALQSAIIEF